MRILATLAAFTAAFFISTASFGDDVSGASIEDVRVIVVDPGHGGEDGGAVAKGGLKEKDITLDIAKELKKDLEKTPGIKVVLTRDSDVKMALENRSAVAVREKADMFLSIHVNSSKVASVDGVETFFLSFDASDSDARELAIFENSADATAAAIAGGNAKKADDLKSILWDLTQTEAHHESARMAEALHSSLVGAIKEDSRGVKQAPFIVLLGVPSPAVLIEVGFLSNQGDLKNISSPEKRKSVAAALAKGIREFNRELGKVASSSGGRQ